MTLIYSSLRRSSFGLVVGLGVVASTACAKSQGCESIDRLVATTYGFHPATLDSAQRVAKSGAMDAFWERVRAHPAESVPCLRSALARHSDDHFFQYDGAALLVSLDSSRQSKEIQLAAAEHVDLGDVALADWMHLVATLGVDGFNTVGAASRWLTLPDSEVAYYPPEHGGQAIPRTDGALILFGSMPESVATPFLTKAITDTSGRVREVALWLLMQQETPAAREALANAPSAGFSADAQRALAAYLRPQSPSRDRRQPTLSRSDFLQAFRALHARDTRPFAELVARVPDGEKDAAVVLRSDDLPEVRFARRYFVAMTTPEAIEYYGDFTSIISTVMAQSGVR